jgi:hypothetical protein
VKRYAQLRIEPLALMLMLMFGMILTSTIVYSYSDPAFSFSPPSSNTVQGKEVPSIMGVKITYPSSGLRVTAGSPLTIFGTSTDNQTTNCTVSIGSDRKEPYQRALAAGPKLPDDYSTWMFTDSGDSHLITKGANQISAVLSCNFGSIVLTKYHSVNIIGVDSSPQPPSTYATDNIQNSNRVTEIEKETHTQKFSQETKNNHADPFLFVMPTPNNNTIMSKTPFQSSKSNLYDKRQLKESVSIEPASNPNYITSRATIDQDNMTAPEANRSTALLKTQSNKADTYAIGSNTTSTINSLPRTVKSTITIEPATITNNDNVSTGFKEKGNSTFMLNYRGKLHPIKYQITGSSVKGISVEKDNTTLLLDISSTSNGKLIIELPRSLIDSKKQGNIDDDYVVFVNGQYTAADEIKKNAQSRTLLIYFGGGSDAIEISGTYIMPEFGVVTPLIFTATILGVILVSMKYRSKINSWSNDR